MMVWYGDLVLHVILLTLIFLAFIQPKASTLSYTKEELLLYRSSRSRSDSVHSSNLDIIEITKYTRAGVTSSLNLSIGHYAGGMKREP